MSYIFPEKKTGLKISFTSEVKCVLCLKNFHVFLYFLSGYYQIWDLIKEQLIISKKLTNDISKFSILNDTKLIYLRRDGALKVHDIFKNIDTEFFAATIPTNLAVNYHNSDSGFDLFKQNVIDQSLLHVDQEKGIIYVLERINSSTIKITHVVTVFNPILSPHPVNQHIVENHYPLQFSYLRTSLKFALWDQFFLDVPVVKTKTSTKKKVELPFFFVGEFENERLAVNKIEVANNINKENELTLTLMGVVETDIPYRVIFFINTNVSPIIQVFDIEKKMSLAQLSFHVSPEAYCISDIHAAIVPLHPKNRMFSFIEVNSIETDVVKLYKFKKNFQVIVDSATISRTDDSIFEVERTNAAYCIEIEKGSVIEENPFRDMRLNVRFFRSMRAKYLSLYLLMRLNVYHIYIIKMIMDFIPE